MAKIKRIFFNGVLTYPMSITDAIIDTDTTKTLTERLRGVDQKIDTKEDIMESIPLATIEGLIEG